MAEPVRSARHRVDGDGWTGLVLGAALVAMTLVAGLIYTFSVAVMPNLADADDRTFVATMQRFNDNPVFQLSFTAALVLTALAVVLQRRHGPGVAVRWTVAALVLYGIVLAVTFGLHIPLNNEHRPGRTPTASPTSPMSATSSKARGWPGTSCAPCSPPRRSPPSPAPSSCTDAAQPTGRRERRRGATVGAARRVRH